MGKKVHINNLPATPRLTPKDALELAAWLVAAAVPLMPGEAGAVLTSFHKLVADAAEGTELEAAALEAAK